MSLQQKLVISFCIFLILLFCIMAVILYNYGSRELEDRAQENLDVVGEMMIQQFDALVRPMEFITVNLIATDNFINSVSALTNITRGEPRNDIFINQAIQYIRTTLMNDSINRNFYSMNVFNEQGDFFSSRIVLPSIRVAPAEVVEDFPWVYRANELRGRTLLVSPHLDPWNEIDATKIFSLVRALYGTGGRIGYIEVQHNTSELDKIFHLPDLVGLKAVLYSNDGTAFYQDGFLSIEEATEFMYGSRDKNYLTSQHFAPFTGFTLYLFQDIQPLLEPLTNIMSLGGIMMAVFLAISILLAVTLYRQLIKPVRTLRVQMDGIDLETLRDTFPTSTSVNDLVALESTFAIMRQRLGEAITRELRSQALQLQANYDALQLQINPHFLYNVLNVISQKGMESKDDEICEICSDLASMLRYSTSTLQRTATVREEINHVEAYVALMQKRYVGRIVFSIKADDAVQMCEIPKITLQQLVENAIKHSFDAGYKEVEIEIYCEKIEYGWKITIKDNGPGFSEQTLLELKEELPELRQKLLNQSTEFAIGGMGLVNTYARLWLFFGDCVSLSPGNNETSGAFVIIEFQEGGPF
jgi:two-component system sensor histidine kinase YesM